MDATQQHRTAVDDAVASGPHPEWGDHDRTILNKIRGQFVVASWGACLLMTALLAAVATSVFLLVSDSPLAGADGMEIGLPTIIVAACTVMGFSVAMVSRLEHVDHDRLVNSLAVGALHVVVAGALLLVTVVITGNSNGVPDAFDSGNPLHQLARAVAVAGIASPTALVACLLSAGMVPARGTRPSGTQRVEPDQDAQL